MKLNFSCVIDATGAITLWKRVEAGGGRSLEWCSWLVNVCVHFIVVGYSLSQTNFGTAWSRRRETGERGTVRESASVAF